MKPKVDGASPNRLPAQVSRYIQEFNASISDEDYASQKFAVRLLFTQRTANSKGQADRVVELVTEGCELAQAIEKQYWVLKAEEKPKRRANEVVGLMQEEGYPKFNISTHTALWKTLDAKNPIHGYGVELGGQWFWYENWLNRVRMECKNHPELYGPAAAAGASVAPQTI
jgi:hypothetical protein